MTLPALTCPVDHPIVIPYVGKLLAPVQRHCVDLWSAMI